MSRSALSALALLALVHTAPALAAPSPTDAYVGTWSPTLASCKSPERIVIVAHGKKLSVTMSIGRDGGAPSTFEVAPADGVALWTIEGGAVRLTPSDAGLSLSIGPVVDGAPKLERELPLVRCPPDGPAAVPVAGKRDKAAFDKAIATYQKTFGPSWLVGTWGLVDSGEDGFMHRAEHLPGTPMQGLRGDRACPRLHEAYAKRWPNRTTGFDSKPTPAELVKAPDGTEVTLEGRIAFFIAADGALMAVQRGDRFNLVPPVRVEVVPATKSSDVPKGAIGLRLGDEHWDAFVLGVQHFHVAPDGGYVSEYDTMPDAVDTRWFMLRLRNAKDLSTFEIARCD
ncbi:MAG: hypothetical protein IT385_14070 [Deltaproteobacteria bacterium]|nr:hypothetical protein [Deltaproteobacteria bacterium]